MRKSSEIGCGLPAIPNPYKELLKSLNFHYASRKRAWYFHADEYHRRSKKEITLDEIRKKYGSERVNNRKERKAVVG